jgi:ubiquinone/menaquinone biosynthesis C-methylase UbiE
MHNAGDGRSILTVQTDVSVAYHTALERVERDHWWFQAMRRLVSETLASLAPAPARVLDVGCSTGHLLDALSPKYDRAGIDFSEDAITHAREARPYMRFAVGSIEALPLEDASFDAVLAIDVISSVGVDDDKRAAAELHRVMRPGGVLITQVAAYEWLRSGHDIGAGTARRYTAPAFGRLLRESGFSDVRITYRVTSVFPLAAAWRLLRRKGSESDVKPVAKPLNWLLGRAMAIEHALVTRVRVPFGLSIFAVARKN